MRKLLPILLLTLAVLLGSAGGSFALPACPSDQNQYYDNCFGTYTWADGNKYVGEFRDGDFNGQGTFTFADGNKYVGEFRDNKPNGQGTSTYGPSSKWAGDKYVGEFRDGKKNGQGTVTYASGDKYIGEFKDDKYKGQGTFTFADGDKYVGEYRENKPNGQGTMTYADGRVEQGMWYYGSFQYAQKKVEKLEEKIAEQKPAPTVTAEKTPTSYSGDFQKGLDAAKRGDFATALREWKPLAEQGHARAQFNLGKMYRIGNGVPQDDKTALKWFRLAAKQGNEFAQYDLGVMYRSGDGVPQNYRTALKWFRLAAEQGDATAQSTVEYLEKEIAKQKPSPTVTAEKPKPTVDRQQLLRLARRTQEALQVLGLYSGKLDGIIGVKTRFAIQQWQKQYGYAGTGEITETQLAMLEQEAITQLAEKKLDQVVEKTAPQPSPNEVIDDQFRVALVIGNGNYGSMGTLPNPANDARLMIKTLKSLGFEVIEEIDATQKQMKRAVGRFSERLEEGGDNSVGLFYYAGHGMQSSGRNYLIPVDAKIDREGDIPIESVAADEILESMESAQARVNFIILDACRNNPFVRSVRSGTRGLARMNSPKGSLIAYATSPGGVAVDGDGDNSPYTLALTTAMMEGDPVERMFRKVRNKVISLTKAMQTPWEASSLIGDDFFFSRRGKSN